MAIFEISKCTPIDKVVDMNTITIWRQWETLHLRKHQLFPLLPMLRLPSLHCNFNKSSYSMRMVAIYLQFGRH